MLWFPTTDTLHVIYINRYIHLNILAHSFSPKSLLHTRTPLIVRSFEWSCICVS